MFTFAEMYIFCQEGRAYGEKDDVKRLLNYFKYSVWITADVSFMAKIMKEWSKDSFSIAVEA